MKQNVKRINESQLRAIVAESVRRILKESMSPQDFQGQLQQAFEKELSDIFHSAADNYGGEEYAWFSDIAHEEADEWASIYSEEYAKKAMEILNSNDWDIPKHNFRPLEFVMREEYGVRNFQELLAKPNPVEIFIDWFFSAYGTYGLTYNFQESLGELIYEYENEEND